MQGRGNKALADIVAPLEQLNVPEQIKLQAAAEIGLWYGLARTAMGRDHEEKAHAAIDAVKFLLRDYIRGEPATKLIDDSELLDNPTIIEITNRMDRWLATRPANRSREFE